VYGTELTISTADNLTVGAVIANLGINTANISLSAANNVIVSGDVNAPNRTISVVAGGSVTATSLLNAAGSSGLVDVQAGTGINLGANFRASNLSARTETGNIDASAPGTTALRVLNATTSGSGNVTLQSAAGPLDLVGNIATGTGTISLRSTGANVNVLNTATITAAGGTAALRSDSGAISINGTINTLPGGTVGDFVAAETVGGLTRVDGGDHQFRSEDPYVVIPFIAGQTYFIQVESGQRWRNGQIAPPVPAVAIDQDPRGRNIEREIDWRRAIGSYQLLVNAMPQQFNDIEGGNIVVDDHIDALGAQSTPIIIGQDPSSPSTNGSGSITGVINNTPQKPTDFDTFRFIAPGNGNVTVRLASAGGSTLNGQFTVLREVGTAVGDGVQQGGGVIELTFPVNAGETFLIDVAGQGTSEGAYVLTLSGMPGRASDGHGTRAAESDRLQRKWVRNPRRAINSFNTACKCAVS
jgi:hypothetical protein